MRYIPTRALFVSGAALMTAAAMLLLPASPAAAAKPQVTITSGPNVNADNSVSLGYSINRWPPSHPVTGLHRRHRHQPRLRLLRDADQARSQPHQRLGHPHRTGRRHLHVHRQGQVQGRTPRCGHLDTVHHQHVHRPHRLLLGQQRAGPLRAGHPLRRPHQHPKATPYKPFRPTEPAAPETLLSAPSFGHPTRTKAHCLVQTLWASGALPVYTLNLFGYPAAPADLWSVRPSFSFPPDPPHPEPPSLVHHRARPGGFFGHYDLTRRNPLGSADLAGGTGRRIRSRCGGCPDSAEGSRSP